VVTPVGFFFLGDRSQHTSKRQLGGKQILGESEIKLHFAEFRFYVLQRLVVITDCAGKKLSRFVALTPRTNCQILSIN